MMQISISDIVNDKYNNNNEIDMLVKELEAKFGAKTIFTGDKLLKYNKKNRAQSKYLKNDDVHLSNDSIIKNEIKNRGDLKWIKYCLKMLLLNYLQSIDN
ncbi:hypothetical protein [Spiroplasma clarkii]|uniref:hypothetical protein n=1 Tax=Spiroplasma clarkii TaxID=2139 RepID=UPI001649D6EA|nr:hypothetical protein [Spiroplasma clarkii]